MHIDRYVVVRPGDVVYERDYAYAARQHQRYGDPMPYATEAELKDASMEHDDDVL